MEVCLKSMTNSPIEKSIEIHAPVLKDWRASKDPMLTRQVGREYVSEWKVGSSFSWKGLDGQIVTNGKIMKREDFTQPVTDKEYIDAAEGWDAALQAVKETAERPD